MDTDLTKSMEEIESDVQQQLVRMNTIENQTRSKKDKLEMLKQQIAEKQAQLEQMEQSHSDEQQSQSKKLASLKRMIHTKKTLLTASAEPIPSTPRSESSQTIFEALQVKMDQLRSISLPKKQSHASNAMMDALVGIKGSETEEQGSPILFQGTDYAIIGTHA
ncbi:hypothetical protein DM01DRAFT_1335806 [Hesseltinella vesiculosa]|uniref:Uncharacterized protein n=1 Tax=Hesseltinella vesiculosa TaxID=101127 RepID=A0A1X2GHI8_9FUNG|nr:hypothetical protein DM01DRAFT_1335806 [Hesseltinella vesiculosa]